MEKKHETYLKYLISVIEKDLSSHTVYADRKDLFNFLEKLKNSGNILKDIYILSRIKNLENLSAYLLFILKKSSEKQINFDNLLENIEEDQEFLKTEFINQFLKTPFIDSHSRESGNPPVLKEKTFIQEEPAEQEHLDSVITNETLEKEFLESKTTDLSSTSRISREESNEIKTTEEYLDETTPEEDTGEITHEEDDIKPRIAESLELIPQQEDLKKEKIFEPPAQKVIEETDEEKYSETEPEPGELYEIPEQKISEDTIMPEIQDEIQNYKNPSKENKKSTAEKFIEFFHFRKQKETPDNEELNFDREPEEYTKIVKSAKEPDAAKEENKQVKKIFIEPTNEDYSDYNKTFYKQEEKAVAAELSEAETADNIIFNEYEKILRERNLVIAEGLNKIKDINDAEKSTEISDEEKEIIENIIADCEYMENYSREMTFEVITNIYSTIKLSLKNVQEKNIKPDTELTELFVDAVILIQKLVSGDDYTGYENTVASIETRQKKLIAEKEKKERAEKLKKEKEEVEKKLEEKYSDTKDRKKLLLLKNKILSVEDIFKTLDTLNGEFLTYEAHRLLSKTFPDFKHIVAISNELGIENMAQLSEASYIFIKYVQNYRIDPFGSDVKEILNYIIVNFKLLFLGKTSKDIEVFISYLNNPDKIFTEKNNSK